MPDTDKQARVLWLDILRIIALCLIVLVHLPAWEPQKDWWVINSPIRLLGAAGVPFFLIISGIFLLPPQKDISFAYILRHMLRLVRIFVVWSTLFMAMEWYFKKTTWTDWGALLQHWGQGFYHLWYLKMMAVMYLVLPFLRLISCHNKANILLPYFLILSFCSTAIFAIAHIFPVFVSKAYRYWPYPIMGFGLYLIAGYYFYHFKISPTIRYTLYLIAMGFLLMLGQSHPYERLNIYDFIFQPLTPWIFLFSMALFLLIKSFLAQRSFSDKTAKRIQFVANYTLGVYLIHPILINIFPLSTIWHEQTALVQTTLYIAILLISFGASVLLYKIPGMRKVLF